MASIFDQLRNKLKEQVTDKPFVGGLVGQALQQAPKLFSYQAPQVSLPQLPTPKVGSVPYNILKYAATYQQNLPRPERVKNDIASLARPVNSYLTGLSDFAQGKGEAAQRFAQSPIAKMTPEEMAMNFSPAGITNIGKMGTQVLRKSVRPGSYTNVIGIDNPLLTKEGREAVSKARMSIGDYREWQSSLFDEIKALPPSPLTQKIDELKDISNVSKGFKDLYRNFETVFGSRFPQVKKAILDPFNNAKADFFQMQDNWLGSLEKQVVKGLGIKKGSAESAAVQQFGEGLRDLPSLIKEFGEAKANKIVEADKWFRASYDDLLNEVNRTRQSIYGQQGIIPKRQDYYRHFTEMAQGFRGLKNIFDNTANISSELAGTSEFTKPRSKWLSMAQKRLGKYTEQDAVGGFLNYLKAASYAKTIDPQIGKFRQLAGELVTQTNETSGANMGRLNNFIEFLHDFSNDLAGKTNPLDRTMQKWVPGGRKTFKVLDWLNSRVKANVILGNVSSSIAQIFSVPQGMANIQNPAIWAKGAGKTLASIFKPNQEMAQSTFIKERYFNSYDKFNTGMLETPKKFAVWMIQVLDEVGTKYIWNMHYLKALESGAKNPVSYADDITKKMVAGRGIGEVPLAQKAKLFQLVSPFQLEVANAWWVMKDMVDERAFGKIASLFVLNHVFNKGAEAIRGSAVVFDPIQAFKDALGELDGEDGALKAGGRLAGEVLSNVPLGQTLAQVYPEYGQLPGGVQGPTRKELFGRADPTRFGGGGLLTKGLQDPLYKVLPPFGGQQVKRSIEGVQAFQEGRSTTPTGRTRYDIEQNPLNAVKSAVFGEYSVAPEGYFANQGKSKSRIVLEKLNQFSPEEQNQRMAELKEGDPSLFADVRRLKLDEIQKVTSSEKKIRNLPVKNGDRAKAIVRKLKGKSVEEQNQLIQDYLSKGIVTKDVLQQLKNAKAAGVL